MKRFKRAGEIRTAVVGYGMGRHHLGEMVRAGMTPVAVVDLDRGKRERAAEDHPELEVFASVKTMLRKSPAELVALVTPHNTHAQLALECLRAGRGVILDKPMAVTPGSATR